MKKITLKITSLLLIGVMLLSSSGIEILAEELPEIIPEENYEPEIPSEDISLPEDTSLDVEDENMPTEEDFQDDSVPEEFFENEDFEENTPESEYVEENNDDIEITEDVEASSDELIYGDFEYSIERDYSDDVEYAVLKSYWGTNLEVEIPDFIDEYPVRKLGNGLFLDRFISKIYIPDSVTSIGQNVFKNCEYMYEINFPQNLTSIGESAFENCISLNSVSLPNNKTRIDSYAFRGCSSLTTVTLPYYATMGSSVFSDCINLEKVKISEACDYTHSDVYYDYISSYHFKNCPKLTEIEIPNGTCHIEQSAFRDSIALQSILLPETLSEIKEFAFKDCSSLTEIEIPDNCSVYEGAFENCTSLKKVVLGNNVSLYDNPFAGCSSLETVILGENVSFSKDDFINAYITDSTEQYMYLLQDGYAYICEYLGNETSVEIPNTIDGYPVKELSSALFQDNTLLSSVIISEGIKVIGANTFSGCTNLTNISIPASITSICDYAFNGCSSLETINLPKSLTHLGCGVFYDCKLLKQFKLTSPSLILDDISYSFYGCENLEYIDLSSAIFGETINAEYMFYGCSKITQDSIMWPKNPENITKFDAWYIFSHCDGIEEFDFKDFPCLKNLGFSNGFYECSGLKYVSFANCKIESSHFQNTFQNCENLHSIDFSGGIFYSFYFYIYGGCHSLQTVDFTNTQFEVFDMSSAFQGCPITNVSLNNSSFKNGEIDCAFYGCDIVNLSIENASFDAVYCYELFAYNTKMTNVSIKDFNIRTYNAFGLFLGCTLLERVQFENVVFECSQIDYLFDYCYSLTDVSLKDVKFFQCQSMYGVFCGAQLTNFTLNNVRFESSCPAGFLDCNDIKSIDFNDTQFDSCSGLCSFFARCINLKYIDFSDSVFNNVNSFSGMLDDCTAIESVNFGSAYFGEIANMRSLFSPCSNLKEVDFGNATFEDIDSMSSFFAGCSNLERINMKNASFTNISDMSEFFAYCSKIRSISLSVDNSDIDTTNLSNAFRGCSSLKTCDLSEVYAKDIIYDSIWSSCNLDKVYLPCEEDIIYEDMLLEKPKDYYYSDSNETKPEISTIIYYGSSADLAESGVSEAEYLSEYTIIDSDSVDLSTLTGKKIICMGDSESNFCEVTLSGLTNSKLTGAGKYLPGEECIVSIELCGGEEFTGWYNSKNKKVSKELSYSFKVDKDTALTAKVKNYKYFFVEPISDQTYSGLSIKPEIEVHSNSTLLHPGVDYSISYANNKKAALSTDRKAPYVKITGKGKYSGTQKVKFSILPKDISSEEFSTDDVYVTYNKKVQKKVPVIKFNDKKLKNKTDFTVSYEDTSEGAYKEVGTYSVKIQGTGNYTGDKTISIHVTTDKLLSKLSFSRLKPQTYTGMEITPELTIKDGKTKLVEGTHYALEYLNNQNIGTASIVITAIEGSGYAGKLIKTFDIGGINISKAKITNLPKSVTFAAENIIFTGENAPILTIKVGKTTNTLVENEDYVISYENNYHAGKAKITFVGINKYIGRITKTFTIKAFSFTDLDFDTNALTSQISSSKNIKDETKKDIGGITWDENKTHQFTYSPNTDTPTGETGITVKIGGKKLKKEEYKVYLINSVGEYSDTKVKISSNNGDFKTVKIKSYNYKVQAFDLSNAQILLNDIIYNDETTLKHLKSKPAVYYKDIKIKKGLKFEYYIMSSNNEIERIKFTGYKNNENDKNKKKETKVHLKESKEIFVTISGNNYIAITKSYLLVEQGSTPKIYTYTNDIGQCDSTLILVPNESGEYTTIMIDCGCSKLYKKIEELNIFYKTNDSSKKSLDIDYLIVTHSHKDHINGLKGLRKKYKLTVKHLYYNQAYFDENKTKSEDFEAKKYLEDFINSENVSVEDITMIYPLQYEMSENNTLNINNPEIVKAMNTIESIKITDTTSLTILPALKKYVESDYTFKGYDSPINPGHITYENDSSVSVIFTDSAAKRKVIFTGDWYCQAFNDVINDEQYADIKTAICTKDQNYTVYYKVSHHGRRRKETFKTDSPYLEYEKAFISELKPDYLIGTSWKASDSIYQKRYKKMIDSIGNKYSPQFYSSFDALFPKHSSKTEEK